MNKKFSTLVASLLLAGGAFSNAYADKLPLGSELEKVGSAPCFLIQTGGTNTSYALGMKSYSEQTKTVEFIYTDARNTAKEVPADEIDQYLWTVSETKQLDDKYLVTFTNVKTGKALYVTKNGATVVNNYTDLSNADANWVWNGYKNYKDLAAGGPTNLYPAYANVTAGFGNGLKVTASGGVHISDAPHGFELYSVDDQVVTDIELNKLYNTFGFNFEIKEGVDNIFDNDQAIKAIKVDELDVDKKNELSFPAGTYFVTETPEGAWKDQKTPEDKINFLLGSTFIALSADDNASTSAEKQKKGEGFKLTTVAGKDLNLYTETNKDVLATAAGQTEGSTISVWNAAFTVKKNATVADKYALSLDRVRIQEAATATKHKFVENVALDIISDKSYGSSEYLVSNPGAGSKFIFTFVESTVAKGTSFIKAEGASIYNIQFVGGVADGSFLTSAYNDGSLAYYAKGAILTDVDAPAFQYVVTKVDGNNVTFTNRETGNSFETMLYPEEGENVYSLAVKTSGVKFDALEISNSGDVVVAEKGSKVNLNLSWVKLIPVAEVDKFAGFLDVEDETKVTLAFARDLTPTSNKLYPMVKKSGNAWSFETNKMTDEASEAAQWQLMKSEKPSYKTYTYAYLNDAEKVVYKTKGDTVAYYNYQINLVNDGLATKYFINTSTGNYTLSTTEDEFIVKENVNGSVSIVASYTANQHMAVKNYSDGKLENLKRGLTSVKMMQLTDARDIKAYLVQDAPEVSLSADASYVSLKSELGNYISMNEERDGIVVNNDPMVIRLFATDLNKVVPSFYITTGWDAESTARMFLMQPQDSVKYYAGAGAYDKEYQWSEGKTKAIFKSGVLNETADTLATTIKGKEVNVAMKADNKGVQGGLESFKSHIILADPADSEDLYIIRSLKATWKNENNTNAEAPRYLTSINDKLAWTAERAEALKVFVETEEAPTANEEVAVSEVSVVAVDGAVVVKGAAGKTVAISNILGQTIANTVIASDNETIAVPAGIVVVAVEGEEAVKAIVR